MAYLPASAAAAQRRIAQFRLYSGATVNFEVRNATKPYILYLFNTSGTSTSNSWVVTSPSGTNKSITKTIPSTGTYMVVIRAYISSNPGTCDLYYNGSIRVRECIVAGNVFWSLLNKTGTLNYFSANPEGSVYDKDTYIFLVTDINQPIAASNDDYHGSGDFNWGWLSRIKIDLNGWPNPGGWVGVIASSYSSGASWMADCYMKNSNQTPDDGMFPNLKADDAINSSWATGNYNCVAWSGGLTIFGVPTFPLEWEWDSYYKNTYPGLDPRYAGTENFERTTNADEAVIDVYRNTNFTHAQVRRYANRHMHGYDWESKTGRDERFFHPRYALEGYQSFQYGQIYMHYKSTGTYAATAKSDAMGINRPLTLKESVDLGLTRINNVYYSTEEAAALEERSKKIKSSTRCAFSEKYRNWERTWDEALLRYSSNNKDFAKSDEYKNFLRFCSENGKTVWPLLFTLINEENIYNVSVLLEELFYPEYKWVMDAIQNRNNAGRFDDDGTCVVYTPTGNWREFCRTILKSDM
ncbi:MAG: hypothetical protein JW913_06180 [Chitinispirillaceae bacterium]|nr:hypothetical protein [Chitinispirillaceae bacterium]